VLRINSNCTPIWFSLSFDLSINREMQWFFHSLFILARFELVSLCEVQITEFEFEEGTHSTRTVLNYET
jgi:hypothetical protein